MGMLNISQQAWKQADCTPEKTTRDWSAWEQNSGQVAWCDQERKRNEKLFISEVKTKNVLWQLDWSVKSQAKY